MRLLLLTKYFPPEIGTASHLMFELAESMARGGHEVTVVTGFPWYNLPSPDPAYRGKIFMRETMGDIRVTRLAMLRPPEGLWRYKTGHVLEPPIIFMGGLLAGRHDAVIAYSPPLLLGLATTLLGKLRRIPSLVNVQDLHPQCLVDLGQLRNPRLIRMLERIERFVYRNSSCVAVHSDGNRDHVRSVEPGVGRVEIVPNWVDLETIRPGRNGDFRQEHDLDGKFVVSFAGTMGIAQGLAGVLEAAEHLRAYEDILFLLVGDGVKKVELVARAEQKDLRNVRFLPMQPKERYPDILAASNVGLVTLGREVLTPVVPSKLLSIMAAGLPAVASVPLTGDTPGVVEAADCGECVDAEDGRGMADAILRLYEDPDRARQMARNGRAFVEARFSRDRVIEIYEELLAEMV